MPTRITSCSLQMTITFIALSKDGEDGRLLREFFLHGIGSSSLAAEMQAADRNRWRE